MSDEDREWYEMTRCVACGGNGWRTYPGGASDEDCEHCDGTGVEP